LSDFSSLGLAGPILKSIAAEGLVTPTPIQAQAIPALREGRDVLGIAQTGTGKTAAFVLPILDRLLREPVALAPHRTAALILAPTRELAGQIADNIRAYATGTVLRVVTIVGGAKPGPQKKLLIASPDIVVATPGRLFDHMRTGVFKADQAQVAVLDEADQMMDLGFLPTVRRIMAKLPKNRQTVLMSATMPSEITELAHNFLTAPEEIAVSAVAKPISRIQQSVLKVDRGDKPALLTALLRQTASFRVIVFTRTKRGADKVTRHLQKSGLKADALHGDKSQGQRDRTLSSFRAGCSHVLVATDIAARGIDIDDVSHVINHDLPEVPDAYVHRIGRTGRAGREGIAISLCDPTERGRLRDIERLIGHRLDNHPRVALSDVPMINEAAVVPKPTPAPAAQPAAHQGLAERGKRRDQGAYPGHKRRDQRSNRRRTDDEQAPGDCLRRAHGNKPQHAHADRPPRNGGDRPNRAGGRSPQSDRPAPQRDDPGSKLAAARHRISPRRDKGRAGDRPKHTSAASAA
jgi:ATP-dependent RNA helicase RhlE